MRVAVPVVEGGFSSHFGGAAEFLFVEGREGGEVVRSGLESAPAHEPGALPRWLVSREVDAVVVSQIGERALIMLSDAGVETYVAKGGGEDDPARLADACLRGLLPRASHENVRCGGHHHDHEGACGQPSH